ncbi:hypothetical protein HOY82DRAFT_604034 [Tuber indicum]|nr:hypothetical protein HOY82DRAFT_604034 [Tuber indicum]
MTDRDENNGRDYNTSSKKRKFRCMTSYSRMTILETEKRLHMKLKLEGVSVQKILEGKQVLLSPQQWSQVKQQVYENLVGYLEIQGYPTEANADFKEVDVNDLILFIIYPILRCFKRSTGRNIYLSREKEIVAADSTTGGMEEFVVMEDIALHETKFLFAIEAKKVSLGDGRKQCFLAMKDMSDNNGGGRVYGFITTGSDKQRWLEHYSTVVNCLNVALSDAGRVTNSDDV